VYIAHVAPYISRYPHRTPYRLSSLLKGPYSSPSPFILQLQNHIITWDSRQLSCLFN
jgi:hypothetical protein